MTSPISAASRKRDSRESSKVPPSFTRIFTEPCDLGEAEQQIHVLNGLTGGAFHQIVDHADHHGPAGEGIELNPISQKLVRWTE